MYDLVLRNGTLIDPAAGIHGPRDLAMAGGRIAAVLEAGGAADTLQTLDVRGLTVVPGLIDFHVHVFPGVSHYGIDADPTCLARGVTTALDFGTAGALTFGGFRRFVLDCCQTRLFALLHISAIGLISGCETQPALGELADLRYCHVQNAVRTIEANRDRIVGVKIRLSDYLADEGKNEAAALELAREAADAAGVPLMVHCPNSSLTIEHIVGRLQAGDVLTHCFHGRHCGIVDESLNLLPVVRDKIAAGLRLDVGHGGGSFAFPVARSMIGQGVLPDTISSDLHHYNLHGPVFDLLTTMDKFLHLGMGVEDVIRRVTTVPAELLGMSHEIGTLQLGAAADVTVLELTDGEFPLTDTEGKTEIASRRFEVRHIIRAGRRVGVLPR